MGRRVAGCWYRALVATGCLLCLAGPAAGSGWQEISLEHVRVVYPSPELAPLAREAAELADAAVVRVARLFGSEPFPVTLRLTDVTDAFNAFATPLPRPTVALRGPPPLESDLGLDARSWLELVILHELAHLAHFTRTAAPTLGLGLVGEGTAPPPPLWLVEGLATWVESELTGGGRRDAARTAGVLATLALGERWPSLAEAGVGAHGAWPGGSTRYLLGVGFLDHLVAEHGWEAVVQSIERYNLGPLTATFADAWEATTGESLEAEWDVWRATVTEAAEARRERLPPQPRVLTDTGWDTGLPALSPAGDRVAWRTWPPAIAVADVGSDAGGRLELQNTVRLRDGVRVTSLDWLDERTLVYTRLEPTAGRAWSDVFSLDLDSGRETQWTYGARARFVRGEPDGPCVRYVRVVPGAARHLARACPGGEPERVWTAPAGVDIVGFDVGKDGRMVVALWRDGRSGLAVLDSAEERLTHQMLTWDDHLDLDPVWTPTGTIRFRSDRTERFEVWEVDPAQPRGAYRVLEQRSATLGGAFEPASARLMVVLTANGHELAEVPRHPVREGRSTVPRELDLGTSERAATLPNRDAMDATPAARPYEPWSTLAPFGWLPGGALVQVAPPRLALEAHVHGRDASLVHAYTVVVGVDTGLSGPAGPLYGSVGYAFRPHDVFTLPEPPPPYTATVEAGMWPHRVHLAPTEETAAGIRMGAVGRWRGGGWAATGALEVGLVHVASIGGLRPEARLDAAVSTAGGDRWGYSGPGVRLALAARSAPTADGASQGVWLDGVARAELDAVTLGVSVRGGYRPLPPIPVALGPLAAVASVEARWHVPVEWRYGDGRYALERVTATPAVRGWADGAGFGFGADLAIGADLLVNYAAPVTLTFRGGWSDRPWFGVSGGFGF